MLITYLMKVEYFQFSKEGSILNNSINISVVATLNMILFSMQFENADHSGLSKTNEQLDFY